jgi:hypothetical protein
MVSSGSTNHLVVTQTYIFVLIITPFDLELGTDSEVLGPIFNRWRLKAAGRVIRHMPICLYADDTSGNSSKKWNKHISYYCTLAGLPPNLTNQHFNCHFLSTSNSAGAMELAEGVVDELM